MSMDRLFGEDPELYPWQLHKPKTPAFQRHSEESQLAALSMQRTTPTLRQRVYELLKAEPCTDEEIAQKLSLNPSTARPRRIELLQDRLIVEVGTRVTKSGRKAAVWGVKS